MIVFNFQEIEYFKLGPWRNYWGYVTEIAQFDDDDIIMKITEPNGRTFVQRVSSWEECEQMIMLVEQDRRF